MDEFSWTGGCPTDDAPPWRCRDGNLRRGGVHELWRRSGLPEAELRHMGATIAMLDGERSTPLAARHVAPILGRIILDHHYNEYGGKYTAADKQCAITHGNLVIEKFFA